MTRLVSLGDPFPLEDRGLSSGSDRLAEDSLDVCLPRLVMKVLRDDVRELG